MNPIGNFTTPSGWWNPIVWVVAFILIFIASYLLWRRGEKAYKKGTMQVEPFLSGNAPPTPDKVHVRAGNIYWGFVTSLKGYYNFLRRIHNGIVNDYVGWYIGILAIMLIIYFLWGGA